MMDNKKILVIAHNSFSDVLNNGKTLESLFKNFKKENLAQLFFSENESPDFDFCDNYFKVTDIDVAKGILKSREFCGKQIFKASENITMAQRQKGTIVKLFDVAKKYADKITLFRDYLWGLKTWKSKNLFQWIENFNPQAIFYVGGDSGFSHEISVFLSKKYNIPLAVYFTDDYLIFPKYRNPIDYLQRQRMKNFFAKSVGHASLCYAIGDLMAKEYTNHFKKEFLPIMNSIEIQEYVPYNESNKKIVFSYFGGLHLNRWKMLAKFAEALPEGVVNVYSIAKPDQQIAERFKEAGIIFKGAVSGDNLQKAILESDVLLHVESDDDYNRSLTKLSVSTKIPEYLMSGRMVIGFGPKDVASMQIISQNEVGLVMSSNLTKNELSSELKKIVEDYEFRKEIGKKGYDFAIKHFNNQIIAEDFKKRMEEMEKV